MSRDPLDLTREYCVSENIPFSTTLADPPYRTYMQLALKSVPNTVVVRGDGTVEKVWKGLLDDAGWKDVLAYFGALGPREDSRNDILGFPENGCGATVSKSPPQTCN